ncbi:MAG TPA: carbohydrate porin [Verrucomicrobiae bacterium]
MGLNSSNHSDLVRAATLALPLTLAAQVSSPASSPNASAADVALTSPGHSEIHAASEQLLGDWGGFRPKLADSGIEFSFEYIGEALGNVSGGLKTGAIYEGLAKGALDFDLAKVISAPGTRLHASALYPHGQSLSETYTGDLFTLSNIDAPDAVRLFELWLEQPLGTEKLTLRVGSLAADEGFAFSEQGCLFINGTCGWPAILGANVPSPAYPQAALGARLAWRPSANAFLQAAIYDGDPNPADANGVPTNPHGVDFTLDEGALILVEGGCGWNQDSEMTLPGNAKLGFFYHTGQFEDLRLDDAGRSLADPASSGVPQSHEGNCGVYAVVEQTLWREAGDAAQAWGVFARLGAAPPDRSLVQYYTEVGFTRTGLLPGRDADTVGVAFVCGWLSNDYRQFARDANAVAGTTAPLPDYEMVLETAYNFVVRPGWTLQPCIEYIIHPGGSAEIENALVLGLRTTLDF